MMKRMRWTVVFLSAVLTVSSFGRIPARAEEEETEETVQQEYTEDTVEDIPEEIPEENIEETAAEETADPVEEVTEEEEPEETVTEEVITETEPVNGNYEDISSDEPSIRGFVVRLYRIALQREPDDAGFEDWTERLTAQTATGVDAVKGFFLSKEMTNRSLSDEEFVKTLYRTVLNREADAGGLQNWLDRLHVHMSRTYVMNGILGSTEFTNLCSKYGVLRGTPGTTGNYRDKNYNISAFVYRMYEKVLGRTAEAAGVEGWCKRILANKETAADLVAGFFFSPEFLKKGLSNEEFVKTAYRALFDREGDSSGIKNWTAKLNSGISRKEVLAGFVASKEFTTLCGKYGITRGSLLITGWKTENGKKYYYKSNGKKAMKEVLTIGGKQYAFDAKGVWIGEKSAAYLQVYKKAIALVNQITTDSMTDTQKLRACFDVFKKFTERNPWIPHYTGDGWVEKYANACFDTHSGNCMSYAVTFAYMAKVLGYEEIYCCNSGGHGWAEIGGLVYDPEWTLHRSGNFFGRPLGTGAAGDPNYKGAIKRVAGSNQYVKL